MDRLKAAIRGRLLAQNKSPSDSTDAKRRLADLDREINQAADNFLRAPSELLEVIGEKLTAMKRQRDLLKEEMNQAKRPAKTLDLEAEVERVASQIWKLGEELITAAPERQRQLFKLAVERIELRFGKHQRGKRVECPLISGEITLRTGEGSIFGTVSRGDCRYFEPWIANYVDTAFYPNAETIVSTRVLRISA